MKMKDLLTRGEDEEWNDLIDKVFVTFLKSDEAKKMDEWKYQQTIYLYQATESTYRKAANKFLTKLQKKYDEITAQQDVKAWTKEPG